MANSAAQTQERSLAGVLGYFSGPEAMLEAMPKVRDHKCKSFDAFSPFPIHGMDDAMGIRRSPLPYVTFFFGIVGFILAFFLQHWTLGTDWPLVIGGKPFFSLPAWAPILFELTVLLAALSTVAFMFLLNGLPNLKKKTFDPDFTKDKFAIFIEQPASESEAKEFLKKIGAQEVRTVYWEGWF